MVALLPGSRSAATSQDGVGTEARLFSTLNLLPPLPLPSPNAPSASPPPPSTSVPFEVVTATFSGSAQRATRLAVVQRGLATRALPSFKPKSLLLAHATARCPTSMVALLTPTGLRVSAETPPPPAQPPSLPVHGVDPIALGLVVGPGGLAVIFTILFFYFRRRTRLRKEREHLVRVAERAKHRAARDAVKSAVASASAATPGASTGPIDCCSESYSESSTCNVGLKADSSSSQISILQPSSTHTFALVLALGPALMPTAYATPCTLTPRALTLTPDPHPSSSPHTLTPHPQPMAAPHPIPTP